MDMWTKDLKRTSISQFHKDPMFQHIIKVFVCNYQSIEFKRVIFWLQKIEMT
ncbi:BnaC06g06640D [Brassica napus]|uniref:BnaC06g06640D protein n=2 Tax=Brassica TaxID=3705 RepID=A0A078HFT6_BRANA|nr:BnaC06g06640D [Brassica napus]